MTILGLIVIGLVMGLVFGFALEKSRVFEPGMIIGQMQLSNFIMLKVFLSATVFGLLILAVLNGMFGVALGPKVTQLAANIIGGSLLGVGFVIAGACPGTSVAQAGAGYSDAWMVLAGGIVGTLFYGYTKSSVADPILAIGDFGKATLDNLLGIPFWMAALGLAILLTLFILWLEKRSPWKDELGANFDGLD